MVKWYFLTSFRHGKSTYSGVYTSVKKAFEARRDYYHLAKHFSPAPMHIIQTKDRRFSDHAELIRPALDQPLFPALVLTFYLNPNDEREYLEFFFKDEEEFKAQGREIGLLFINPSYRIVAEYVAFSPFVFESTKKDIGADKQALLDATKIIDSMKFQFKYVYRQLPSSSAEIDEYWILFSKERHQTRAFNPIFFKTRDAALSTLVNMRAISKNMCKETEFATAHFPGYWMRNFKCALPPGAVVNENPVELIPAWQISFYIIVDSSKNDIGTLMYTDFKSIDEGYDVELDVMSGGMIPVANGLITTVRWLILPTKTKGKIDLFNEERGSYISRPDLIKAMAKYKTNE